MKPISFPRCVFSTGFETSSQSAVQRGAQFKQSHRGGYFGGGRSGVLLTLAAVLCVMMAPAPEARAQQATAKVVGTVSDQQGLVVQGVKVIVTSKGTDLSSETTTDKNGYYQVLNLPIGAYTITATHEGFRTIERTTAPLEINQVLRVDLKLEVGQVSEKVLVEGQAESVETVNPTLGQSVTSRPIVNLPLNGRNVLDLALLQPGVSESNPDDGSAGHFNVGGGRSDSVTFLLDGGMNNDLLGNEVVLNPNPDTIAEFRILTSNYTAEYGRNGAGVISMVTKSGSNQFHGSAFEFARNTAFDATPYFAKQEGLGKNDLKRHQFGGTFGGPITIPHLLEGKDRFFFFVSYQGQRQTQSEVSTTGTFTPAELNNGDFSAAPDASSVVSFLQSNPYFVPAGGSPANAIIDPAKFDPAAIAYINLGLIPTSTFINGGLAQISQSATATDNRNELTVKVDLNLTTKDKLAITLGGNRNPTTDPFSGFNSTILGFGELRHSNSYYANIGYTRDFSPTLLNEFLFTAHRRNGDFGLPISALPTAAQLGFGILSDTPNGPPQIYIDEGGLEFGTDPQGPAFEIGNTFAYTDTVTWVKGRNTWKFGGGFSAYQNNTTYDFYGNGIFDFYQGFDPGGTGDSLADFLIGTPYDLFEGPNAGNNIRSKAVYGYLQDEWRVRKNLVLSLGMRYEYSTPKRDTQGRTFSIVPGAQSTRFPNAPLGLVFPGDARAPQGVNFPDRDNFAPRVGFAWDPKGNGKMSIRGGIGLFYDVLKGEDNLQFNGAPPFYSEVDGFMNDQGPYVTNGAPFFSNPWPQAGLSQPFPSQPPTKSSAFDPTTGNSLPFGGGGIYFVDPHLHTPYTYQYNLSLQDEIARNLTLELNYVGSSSKGLTSLVDVNPFDLSTVNGPNPTRILNYNQTTFADFCSSFGGFTGYAADCPISIANEFGNISFASFNSMEASLTKQNGDNRYIGNTYFTLGYTWAHSIDNASGFRNRSSNIPYYNHSQFRASSDFDLTNRITFSGGWDLPFDKMWDSGPKRLVRGWSLYPIFTWRTGFPLTINSELPGGSYDPGPSGAGDSALANAIFADGFSSISIMNPRKNGNLYFNPAAFEQIPDVPGNGYGLPRNFFRGPHRTNLDLAVAKTTGITERLNAEFRVEAFNLFNHGEFNNPDTGLFDPTFGQVYTTDFGSGVNLVHTERILQIAARLTF